MSDMGMLRVRLWVGGLVRFLGASSVPASRYRPLQRRPITWYYLGGYRLQHLQAGANEALNARLDNIKIAHSPPRVLLWDSTVEGCAERSY